MKRKGERERVSECEIKRDRDSLEKEIIESIWKWRKEMMRERERERERDE